MVPSFRDLGYDTNSGSLVSCVPSTREPFTREPFTREIRREKEMQFCLPLTLAQAKGNIRSRGIGRVRRKLGKFLKSGSLSSLLAIVNHYKLLVISNPISFLRLAYDVCSCSLSMGPGMNAKYVIIRSGGLLSSWWRASFAGLVVFSGGRCSRGLEAATIVASFERSRLLGRNARLRSKGLLRSTALGLAPGWWPTCRDSAK